MDRSQAVLLMGRSETGEQGAGEELTHLVTCHPVLVSWLPSLRPGVSDWQTMLESLGELYVRGRSIGLARS